LESWKNGTTVNWMLLFKLIGPTWRVLKNSHMALIYYFQLFTDYIVHMYHYPAFSGNASYSNTKDPISKWHIYNSVIFSHSGKSLKACFCTWTNLHIHLHTLLNYECEVVVLISWALVLPLMPVLLVFSHLSDLI